MRRQIRSTVRRLLRRSAHRAARAVMLEAVEGRRLLAATITGKVGLDTNHDGVADTALKTSYSVFADYNYNGVADTGEPQATTTGLNYSLSAEAKPFALRLAVPPGATTTQPANNQPYYYGVTNGVPTSWGSDFVLNAQTTLLRTAVVTDLDQNGQADSYDPDKAFADLWVDTNRNGTHDAGEPKLESFFTGNGDPGFHPTAYETGVAVGGTYRIAVRLAGDTDLIADRTIDVAATDATLNFKPLLFAPKASVITGRLFDDKNNNGVYDGESEQHYQGSGATNIYSDLNNNGVYDAGEPSASFDLFGPYAIEVGNRAGVLRVDASTIPAGLHAVPASRAFDFSGVTGSQVKTGQDFALTTGSVTPPPPATTTITGYAYVDTNNNGFREAGEGPAVDVQVFADYNYNGTIDAGEPIALTNGNTNPGVWTLNVEAKPFALRAQSLAGAVLTSPTSGAYFYGVTNGVPTTWTSTPTFGERPASTGKGLVNVRYVFEDTDADGQYDRGELGLSDVRVWAETDNNGVFNPGEQEIAYAPSGQSGSLYSIAANDGTTAVPIGSYWIATSGKTADGQTVYTRSYVTVTAGQTTTLNLALPQFTPRIDGKLFLDANRNGKLDSGEGGGPGTIWADYNNDGLLNGTEPAVTSFDSDGYYSLAVARGTFPIRFTPAAGYDQTLPASGQVNSVNTNNTPYLGLILYGEAPKLTTNTTTLVTHVYKDSNGNGTIDASEAVAANGASGQTLYADYNYNGILDAGEASATSDASGTATLVVQNKPFALRVKVPTGTTVVTPGGGSYFFGVTNGVAQTWTSNLVFGVDVKTPVTTISGRVYFDANGNGTYDAGETLRSGDVAQVFIDTNDNRTYDGGEYLATIGADGRYTFTNVRVGTSGVIRGTATELGSVGDRRELIMNDDSFRRLTATTAGSDATNGPDVGFVQRIYGIRSGLIVDVDGNGQIDDYDRGVAPADAWLDFNGNGRHDAGEPNVYGYLYTPDADVARFDNYNLSVSLPAGDYVLAIRLAGDNDLQADVIKSFPLAKVIAGTPDYALVPPTTSVVTGVVFSDDNANGSRESNENGSSNRMVYVDLNNNGQRDLREPATYTAHDGRYALEVGNRAGVIRVELAGTSNVVTRPAGRSFDFSAGTGRLDGQDLGIGAATSTVTQTIDGHVFDDVNSNGKNDNEPGLLGKTVWADYDYDGLIDLDEPLFTTDGLGNFHLDVLVKPFALRVLPGGGSTVTAPGGGAYFFGVANGVAQTWTSNLVFGVKPSTPTARTLIAVQIYPDRNGDGVIDPTESGLGTGAPGQFAYADYNNNGMLDVGEDSAISDSEGRANLSVLNQPFKLRLVAAAGYRQSVPAANAGFQYTITDGVLAGTGATFAVANALPPSTPVYRVTAFLTTAAPRAGSAFDPAYYYFFGKERDVWLDLNHNSTLDAGERVFEYSSDSDFDPDVRVLGLENVPYGDYVVAVGKGTGVGTTAAYTQNVTVAPQPNVSIHSSVVQFFSVVPVSPIVTGTFYADANRNGVKDPGEILIAGENNNAGTANVFADYNFNGLQDADEPSAIVDYGSPQGFSDLNGQYVLKPQVGRAFQIVGTGIRSQTTLFQTGSPPTLTVSAGDAPRAVDIGFADAPAGTVFVSYYVDFDGDGLFNSAVDSVYPDPALGNRGPYVDFNRNNVFDGNDQRLHTYTRIGGSKAYYFAGLADGTYHLVLDDGLAAGESVAGGPTREFTVANGAANEVRVPVVGYKYARLVPQAFLDKNGNAAFDEGEILDYAHGANMTVFADLNFNGLPDAGEPADSLPSGHDFFGPHLDLLPGSYSIRIYDRGLGRLRTFAYGADSRWVTLGKPAVYPIQMGIVS